MKQPAKYQIEFNEKKGHFCWIGQGKPHLAELLCLLYLNRIKMPGPWSLARMRIAGNPDFHGSEEELEAHVAENALRHGFRPRNGSI